MVEPEVADGVPDSVLDATPSDRARAAADALGVVTLTRWCGDLLAGRSPWGDPHDPHPGWVAGRVVLGWGSPDHLDDDTRYWSRVWAARTLLHVWDDDCAADVVAGLGDPAWRVREMCCKVAARWEVGSAADDGARLVGDAVPRVRAAAVRLLGAVGESEHANALHEATDDDDAAVHAAAERGLRQLAERLDHPV